MICLAGHATGDEHRSVPASVLWRTFFVSCSLRGSLNPAERASRATAASVVGASAAVVERRSPNRPKFVVSWKKSLEPESVEASRVPKEQQMDHIDIWLAHPDSLLRAHSCLKLLTKEDWALFDRINDGPMRNSAMAARILLRLGLSQAVDRWTPPTEWKFRISAHGKPVVADALPDVRFSVSHADQLAAVGISLHAEIGIDVESVDQNVSENVTAGFSHPHEKSALSDLLPRQKVRESVRLWTFKEALSKIIGTGMSLDFETIQFTLDPVRLASAGRSEKGSPRMLFESIYISVEHVLHHISLGVKGSKDHWRPTEVRIVTLAELERVGVSSAAPVSR
jgi:phosphopantetheinyl transferase